MPCSYSEHLDSGVRYGLGSCNFGLQIAYAVFNTVLHEALVDSNGASHSFQGVITLHLK